jgi:murein DD-endopeptidase MepM/ murein hydrolase activator NlpD
LSQHRGSQSGDWHYPELATAVDGAARRVATSHRISPPSSALRGRVMIAAVAAGAFAAAAAGQAFHLDGSSSEDVKPLASTQNASALMGGMGGSAPSGVALDADGAYAYGNIEVLPVTHHSDSSSEAAKLTASVNLSKAAQEAEEEARAPKFVRPAQGTFTSGFGGRWGAMHYGVDIANHIGTPIVAVADGVVIEAGTASGFGLWVRIQHEDGTISVYGHVNDYVVHEGQHVKAGQLIAHIGNRGQSTGPHLHFEIWDANGRKMNPQPWLAARGIDL